MGKVIISPSILSGDFANLEADIKRLEDAGADWVHVDVMDGHFVPNLTIGAPVVKAIKRVTNVPLDVHLMIDNPQKYIKDFALAGADIITFHYEAAKNNSVEIIEMIKSYGIKAGISIKPASGVKEIINLFDKLDLILIMTVEPGFGGQKFIFDCAKKIAEIKSQVKNNIIIEADGGINNETAQLCKKMGADALVAGHYIFSSNNFKEAIEALR